MTMATTERHEGREGRDARPSGRGLGRALAARAPRCRPSDAGRCVAVIGAGYVGLPTAAVLAHFGHRVVCAERDPARLRALRRGEAPIVEPGLEELMTEGTASGTLRFVDRAPAAAAGAEVVFLCVATPQHEDGSADLSDLEAVVEELAPHLAPGAVLVNKSTVPVGTGLLVERVTARPDIAVVSNPEFLREGSAVRDTLSPDRLVVGADDVRAAERVAELFAPSGAPLIITDTQTAEAIKYASNAFLATKLSFVNSLAGLCEAVGADVRDVVLGLGYDRRIGFDYLRPGPGWGGSFLPQDTRAPLALAEDPGVPLEQPDAVRHEVVEVERAPPTPPSETTAELAREHRAVLENILLARGAQGIAEQLRTINDPEEIADAMAENRRSAQEWRERYPFIETADATAATSPRSRASGPRPNALTPASS